MAETLNPSLPLPAAATLRSPFAVADDAQHSRGPGASHPRTGQFPDAAGNIGVKLHAQTLPSVTLISTWNNGLPALMQAVTTMFDGAVLQSTGHAAQTPLGLLARTGPLEFLLIGEQADARRVSALRDQITADIGSVTDLSHARCRIRIQGPQCRTALNKLFALDLRESAFAVGQVKLSGTHHVPGMLYRTGVDAFDWIVFSTYAQDQLETLTDAALEYGVEITVGA